MTIKELKEELKDIPDDYLVVMSNDAEGNTIRPMHELSVNKFVEDEDGTWDGSLDPYDSDEDNLPTNCVTLWPK